MPAKRKPIPLASAVVTAGEAKALLSKIDNEAQLLDAAIRATQVDKKFRRAWLQFLASWRDFFLSEKDHPSTAAPRAALMFAADLKRWRVSFSERHRAKNDEVGAFVVMPGAIKDELETVNTGVKQLDSEIAASKAREAFKTAWQAFSAEWQKFYASNQGWWARSWGGTYEKAVDYRKRVDEWRAAFQREGGQPAGPALTPAASSPSDSAKWIVVGALLVVGAVIGAKAFK